MNAAPIGITFFKDFAATEQETRVVTVDDLARLIGGTHAATKATLPWLKMARFGGAKTPKGSLRHDRNLICITGIEGDYDLEKITFDEAVEIAAKAGLGCIIYTSPSHTPANPRWRVLCPTSRELPPNQRDGLVDRLNGLFRGCFATESWTLSQAYFFGRVDGNPHHRVEIIEGEPVDLLDDLDLIRIGKPQTATKGNGAGGDHSWPGGVVDEPALLEEIRTGAGYHVPAMRLLGHWALHGVSLIEAKARLEAAFNGVFPPDRDQRWSDRVASIPEMLAYIWPKDGEKRDADSAAKPSADGPIDAGEDTEAIPPRAWLLGNTFCRGFISGLLAQGASAKTTVRIAQALALATGRALTGEHVFVRSRVLIVTLEDNIDELRRRVRAARMRHGIAADDVRGWLYLWAPAGLKIAEQRDGSRTVAPGELDRRIRAFVAERAIDLVIVDPLVKAHSCEENDNGAIDQVALILAALATDLNIAIDTAHHAPKAATDPGDANRARGASAFRDASRLLYTVTGMSEAERDQFGLSEAERRALVRVDSAKVNIAPPSVEAKWFKIIGVPLDNGTELYPHGDTVPTVEPWRPPDMWREINDGVANAILDTIEAGPSPGRRYSAANRAEGRAASLAVLKHCPNLNEKQARQVIATWISNGMVETRDYDDPADRKPRSGLFVIKRAG